jgi:hypothetical protein
VDCRRRTQGQGLFSCQFCIEVNDIFTCYNLEKTASNIAADAALTDLEEGTYRYRVTASLDEVPVASIYDLFSTGKYCLLVFGWGLGIRVEHTINLENFFLVFRSQWQLRK